MADERSDRRNDFSVRYQGKNCDKMMLMDKNILQSLIDISREAGRAMLAYDRVYQIARDHTAFFKGRIFFPRPVRGGEEHSVRGTAELGILLAGGAA